MFTERDVVRAIAEHGAAGVNMRVSQFISVQQLVSCTSTDTLEHVRHLMSKHHIRHVPVIDNYSLIGVISIRDIFNAFDRITYQKGATVIGMFEGWIGEESFRSGVRNYLEALRSNKPKRGRRRTRD